MVTQERTFDFEKTSIPSQYGIDLYDNHGLTWVDTRSADIYRVLFTSIADCLKFKERKDAKRIGFSMKDAKGNIKLGAILSYKAPEEGSEEDSGNWYLEMTFDPEDMKDLDIDIDNHSDEFVTHAANNAHEIANGRFRTTEMMFNVFDTAIDTLKNFLDFNVEAGDLEVTLRGIFTASAAIEDGKKVLSIVPGEIIKQIIKNDSAL